MKKLVIVVAVFFGLTANGFSADPHAGIRNKYSHEYYSAKKRCDDKTAVGRNIRRLGLRGGKQPKKKHYARSIQTLTSLCRPQPVIVNRTSSTTAVPSTGGATAGAGENLVQCIIRSESGGDPTIVNPSGHAGVGQWAQGTWVADGGTRFAPTPTQATYDQQVTIIREQVAAGNEGQWTKYDPC